MVEPEVAYATLDDIMELAEGLVVSVVARVLDGGSGNWPRSSGRRRRSKPSQRPFARMTYDEAARALAAKGLPFEWGGDFGGPDETALSEMSGGPVVVTGYPSAIKAFYFKPRSRSARGVALGRRARARRLRRDHRRRPAHRRLRPAAAADQGTSAAAARRTSGISICGGSAACRTPASAWASSASWPGSRAWNICAKRFRTRACCTAFIPEATP